MAERHVSPYRRALRGRFSPWIKVPYTIFVGVLVPVYWSHHGPGNFLWFSDIALFGALIALWFELRLLAGMMALAVLLPELVWNIGFFGRLLMGADVFGIADYMFDAAVPLPLRVLSLFHAVLPPLLLWLVYRLGYDSRALVAQTLFGWTVLILSYLLAATPARNVNWTLGVGDNLVQAWLPGWLWVLVLMIAYPVLVYVPTHLLLRALFDPAHQRRARSVLAAFARRARRSTSGAAVPDTADREGTRLPGRARYARLRDRVDFVFVRPRRRR